MTDEAARHRLSTCVLTLRWLAARLADERSGYAHVPGQIADVRLDEAPALGCSICGRPLPEAAGTGRPRSRCLTCSPRRSAGVAVNVRKPDSGFMTATRVRLVTHPDETDPAVIVDAIRSGADVEVVDTSTGELVGTGGQR